MSGVSVFDNVFVMGTETPFFRELGNYRKQCNL